MALLEWLDKIDKSLFTLIHADGAIPQLDWLMLGLRHGTTWIPLYAFILYWAIRNGKKLAVKFIAVSVLCIALSDLISSSLLKPLFGRMRPCFDAALEPIMRNIINCGGIYSMPSGHATNHFALATCWFFSVFLIKGKKWYWLWLWAALICYAQIYVGKHYPFDILVGACLGSGIGYSVYLLFKKWSRPPLGH